MSYSTYVNRLMNCPAGTVPPLKQPNTVTWLKDLAMEDYSLYADKLSQRVGIDPTVPFDSTINNPHIKFNDSNNPKMEYESLDNVPLIVKTNSVLGSRKMSFAVVKKLVNRYLEFTDEDGRKKKGASNDCIKTMVYFCQINDNHGYIPNFEIKSLVGKTVNSKRGAYSVLDLLERKRLIKIEKNTCKNGLRNITVLDNDFSNYGKNKRVGYLNLNREFFNTESLLGSEDTEQSYSKFCSLSLFAKKMLLYILYMYDSSGSGKNGYRKNIKKLSDILEIDNTNLIYDYVKELEPLFVTYKSLLEGFKSDIYTYKSKSAGSDDVILTLRRNRCGASGTLIENAPTNLKYRIRNMFKMHGVEIRDYLTDTVVGSADLNLIANRLAGVVTWNSLRCMNSPVNINDLLDLLEKFICECEYFTYEHIQMFDIYAYEFVQLSRSILPPNYIMSDMA